MTATPLENGWLDHFPGSSLDSAIWGSVTAGSGTVTVGSSYADINCPAASDAAFIYYKTPLSKTKHSIFRACIRAQTAPALPDLMGLYRDSSTPVADDEAGIQDVLLAGMRIDDATPYMAMERYTGDASSPSYGSEDFESLSDGNSIGTLANWTVDYGHARCSDDATYGKCFEAHSTYTYISCYTRITDATNSVDQWMAFEIPLWLGINSIGAGFRMSGSTGNRYFMRIRDSGGSIEWARETGNSSFSRIQLSSGTYTPSDGDYVGFQISGTGASTVAKFWNFGATPPSTDGPSAWGAADWTSSQDPTNVGGNDYSVDTGDYCGLTFYKLTSGGQLANNVTWGPYAGASGPTFETHNLNTTDVPRIGATEDFYTLGLEIDGTNGKVRGHIHHAATGTFTDTNQGLTLVAMTGWEDIDAGFSGTDLYACVGNRYTDAYAGRWHVEWAYIEEVDTPIHAWANSRDSSDPLGGYQLRKFIGYGTQFMPKAAGDGAIAVPWGSGGSWNDAGYRGKFVCSDGGTYYMFLEGSATTNFGDAEIGIFTASDPDGTWTEQTRLDPATIIGTGYVDMSHAWIGRDDGEAAGWKYKMLIMATKATYAPRIFLLHSDSLTSGWAKYTGSGTDGSVIDASGSGWREDGVSEITVAWDTTDSTYKAMLSGFKSGIGWTIGILESDDKWRTWTTPASVTNPIIPQGGVSEGVAAVSGKTITVADGTDYTVDAVVAISDSAHTDVNYSRIRAISGNDLELYHEISGVTTSHDIEQVGSGSISAIQLQYSTTLSKWVLVATVFQPFITTGDLADSEFSGVYTASTLIGTWTQDWLQTFNIPRENSTSGAHVANENLRQLVTLDPIVTTGGTAGIILNL